MAKEIQVHIELARGIIHAYAKAEEEVARLVHLTEFKPVEPVAPAEPGEPHKACTLIRR